MGRKSVYKWQRRGAEIALLEAYKDFRELNEEEKKRLDILNEMFDNKPTKRKWLLK